MAEKEIVWTITAAKQRRAILEFWNNNNKSIKYAEKLILRIKNRLDTLVKFPFSGKKTAFQNTLVTSLGHYSIFYQVKKNTIIVTGFWDNRQDPKRLYDLLNK